MSTSMTMIITIVPPVGPPVPVLVGKAIQDSPEDAFEVYLDEKFDRDGVYFETEDKMRLFPNGTIIDSDGKVSQGAIHFGAVNSRDQRKMLHLEDILKIDQLNLNILRRLNEQRKARKAKIVSKRSAFNSLSKDYIDILTNYFKHPINCSRKLKCLNTLGLNCRRMDCE